jgi:MoaA/NifB/PqqE/SkfB family radical SAM enzyme
MSLNSQFVQLAASNAAKYGRQKLNRWTASVIGQPTSVFAVITNRCNLHCLQCDIPLTGDRKSELSTEEWKKAIGELRGWLGTTLIRWSGGEPFVRKDMIDIVEYSSSIGVLTGINTNGHYISEAMAERLAKANVFNMNFSMDGMKKGHDHVRGAGQFDRVLAAARRVNEARKKFGASTKIIIKVTIMETNLDELEALADLVRGEGFDALSVSALEETFATAAPDKLWYASSPLWPKDAVRVNTVIDALKARTGANGVVFNSRAHLESMKEYYRDPNIPTPPDFKCHVGQDHFRINFNGDVVMCPFKGVIGNLARHSPAQIWKSDAAAERRDDIDACRKKCLIACLYKRDVKEYTQLLFKLL